LLDADAVALALAGVPVGKLVDADAPVAALLGDLVGVGADVVSPWPWPASVPLQHGCVEVGQDVGKLASWT